MNGGQSLIKEQRLAARGDRILDALATLIIRWGYGKTTVEDVARTAGVAKGTVYLHWPSKGAMLHALLEREERVWNEILLERMAADPRGGTISGIYRHALALSMEQPLLRALLTQDRDALGEWTRSPQSRARSRRRMDGMHALIETLRAAGLMRSDLSVQAQAYLLAALTYGMLTIESYLPAEFVPPRQEVLDAFAVVTRHGFEPAAADDAAAQARTREGATMTEVVSALLRALAANQAAPDLGTTRGGPCAGRTAATEETR